MNKNEQYEKSQEPTKLAEIRRRRNLSQAQLAHKSGVPKRTIECFEQRYRDIDGAHLNTLLDLCIVLNCNLADILESEEVIQKLEKVCDIF